MSNEISRISREPVAIANAFAAAIIALIKAILVLALAMGWVMLTDAQMVAWITVATITLDIFVLSVATYFGRSAVTPLIDPRDDDDEPLTRSDNMPSLRAQKV